MEQQGIEGSIIQMISHGLVSAALFLCVGVVYDRMHSRLIDTYGGIVAIIPKYSVLFMLFTLAALGLPGTSGFVGEFLILMGAFKVNILVATIASLGVILAAAYMLWLYKRVIFELSFLKTPKTSKNIIDSETNISGNTKLRFSIYLTIIFKLCILIRSFTETSIVLINGSG